jgi:ankyrin repeat protein
MASVRLHEYAASGDVANLKALIGAADVNEIDARVETALHKAAANNHTVAIRLLIEHGAKLDVSNGQGNTPLHKAAENGHGRAVAVLIDLGAPVNKQNHNGETPLHLAIINNNAEVVRDLILLGANLKMGNRRGQNAQAIAKAYNCKEATVVIKEHYDQRSLWSKLKDKF